MQREGGEDNPLEVEHIKKWVQAFRGGEYWDRGGYPTKKKGRNVRPCEITYFGGFGISEVGKSVAVKASQTCLAWKDSLGAF